jgi:hypothetical protein
MHFHSRECSADVAIASFRRSSCIFLIYAIFSLCTDRGVEAIQLSTYERKVAERIVLLASTEQGRTELHSQLLWAGDQGDIVNNDNSAGPQTKQILSDGAPATKQGAGFKVPFYPGNSTVFDPLKSKTFRVVPKQVYPELDEIFFVI